ncbi:MAG: hypothetical protein HYU29_05425 [Chloroflexi bacterium]|nr:hypothetical protein [Chloroflexota bacterium]
MSKYFKIASVATVLALLLAFFSVRSTPTAADHGITVATVPATFTTNADKVVTVTAHIVAGTAGLDAEGVALGAGVVNKLDITVKNTTTTATTNSITVRLTETGAATWIFGGGSGETFTVTADTTDDATNKIKALHGEVLQLTWFSLPTNVTVDARGPTVAVVGPADKNIGKSTLVTFEANIEDLDSGIDDTGADVTLELGTWAGDPKVFTATKTLIKENFSVTKVTTAKNINIKGAAILAAGDTYWQIKAKDKSGNETKTDADAATTGSQPFKITVDNEAPKLDTAWTGYYYDETTKTVKTGKNTSVRLAFVNVTALTAEDLNPASVSVADFLVANVAPTAAVAYDSATHPNAKGMVFLTVPAMAANLKPAVAVVGEVADTAGNAAGLTSLTAADKLGPTFTVTITGEVSSPTRQVSRSSATIRVVSDEAVGGATGAPTIIVSNLAVGSAADKVKEGTQIEDANPSPVSGLTYTWEKKILFTAATVGGAGLKNVRITGVDSPGGTEGKKGEGAAGADIDLTKALLFEFDDKLNNGLAVAGDIFSISPKTGGDFKGVGTADETDTASPFISIKFTAEGTEYPVGTVKADSSPYVELTKATLKLPDGTTTKDVLSAIARQTDTDFVYVASGLALGSYELTVQGKDKAGNISTASLGDVATTVGPYKFKVVEKAPFEVALVPGWNLISLPQDSIDPSINVVIASDHPISTVLTYDPKDAAGPWLTAVRDPVTKLFTGTLATIDSKHAYFVRTDSFKTLKVTTPALEFSRVPPAINLAVGWNLVPVSSLAAKKAGDPITAATYFGTVKWVRAYRYDTTTGAWVPVQAAVAAGFENDVKVGSGYWVYVTEAGVLIP